ncbi:hypothetical protein E2C01_063512 [Portunus trituberculatus]|uniref:Uncharacterized protein n=1 Tax=Portunus trituberculatus TaxID=210409 RepID=A0A5B7HGK1_PORTR|nr:hypothetical protein [Portunus trituberculatus]
MFPCLTPPLLALTQVSRILALPPPKDSSRGRGMEIVTSPVSIFAKADVVPKRPPCLLPGLSAQPLHTLSYAGRLREGEPEPESQRV